LSLVQEKGFDILVYITQYVKAMRT